MNLNTGLYLQFFTFISLVFCGLVQYFTGNIAVLWLPFLLSLMMVALLMMQTRYDDRRLDTQERLVLTLYLSFLAIAGTLTLLQSGLTDAIVGFKNEIALSLIMFCLLLGFCRESQILRVTRSLYWVFYAQFPVVLYQVLVVLPQRVALSGAEEKWDSVVGTFGGDPMGGGNTAAMGMFCLLIMLLKVSEFKHGIASFWSMALHITLAFGLCILGEVKFVILLAPLLLTWLWLMPGYVKGVNSLSIKAVLLLTGGMALLIVLAIVILAAGYSSAFGGDPTKSAFSVFADSLGYIFDSHYIMASGELGRFTTLVFWWENNDLWGVSGTLFGYGLNATNSGSAVSPGYLNLIFNLILDSTSLSMLLWEVGAIGTLFFIGLFISVLTIARPRARLEREQLDRQDLQLLSFSPAFTVFACGCLLSVPYSQILMIIPMLQFLFYLSLGANLVIRRSVHRYTEKAYE